MEKMSLSTQGEPESRLQPLLRLASSAGTAIRKPDLRTPELRYFTNLWDYFIITRFSCQGRREGKNSREVRKNGQKPAKRKTPPWTVMGASKPVVPPMSHKRRQSVRKMPPWTVEAVARRLLLPVSHKWHQSGNADLDYRHRNQTFRGVKLCLPP